MPANNRVHSSAALQTHGIWQSAIGYDPYAPEKDSKVKASDRPEAEGGTENAYASFQGLLALARITGSSANDTRGACKRCGRVGHLTYQCRNFLSVKEDKEKDDVALQSASAVFDKIKRANGLNKGEEEEGSSSEEEESESSDSDVDPEIEKIIAARMGKNKKRADKDEGSEKDGKGRSRKRSGKRSSHASDDDIDEKEDVRRKEKKRRRRRGSDDDEDEEVRREEKRNGRRPSGLDGDEEVRSKENKERRRRHRSSDDDDEEEPRRRERKHRRRRRSPEDEEVRRKERKPKRRHGSSDDDSSEEDDRRRHHRKNKTEKRSRRHKREMLPTMNPRTPQTGATARAGSIAGGGRRHQTANQTAALIGAGRGTVMAVEQMEVSCPGDAAAVTQRRTILASPRSTRRRGSGNARRVRMPVFLSYPDLLLGVSVCVYVL